MARPKAVDVCLKQWTISFPVRPILVSPRVEKHRKEAFLAFELQHVSDTDSVRAAALAAPRRNDLDIRVLDYRLMHIIGVGWRRVVYALVEIPHFDDIAGL